MLSDGADPNAVRPLLQYLRYNVQIDSDWLKKNLKMSVNTDDDISLKEMDKLKNMPMLSKFGVQTAALQIEDHHFPPGNNLGE